MTCDTNKATLSKTKKFSFSLAARKFGYYALWDTSHPHSNFFQAANQYIFGRKSQFAFLPKDCTIDCSVDNKNKIHVILYIHVLLYDVINKLEKNMVSLSQSNLPVSCASYFCQPNVT